MTITIRPATLADVPRITKMVNEAYRGETGKRGWTTEAHLLGGVRTDEQEIADLVDAERNVILVALDSSGQPQGCVYLKAKDEATGYLGMLTVQVDTQSRGWGSKLVDASEAFVKTEWGVAKMEMQVITVRRELIAWYERRGYRDTGERRPFPHDDQFGKALQGSLEFLVLEKTLL
ncbi:MAG: GNAT family N-acetyltransferase [Bdellovibrionota bacterium]